MHYIRSPDIRAIAPSRSATFERLRRNEGLLDRPTMLAIERYDNRMFRSIEPESLDPDARGRLDEQLLIFSGMWGLVRPTDQIPDYHLAMTSRMPQVSTLATFWRPSLSAAINRVAANSVVWDLTPASNALAWTPGKHPTFAKRIFVRFRTESGRDVSAKDSSNPIRGTLVRFLVEHQPAGIDDLEAFTASTGWGIDRTRLFNDGLRVSLVLSGPPTS